ncbi:hypothetical protein ACFQY0_03080 [Haloferula chungangensis]|uniref:Uncharacterized protein n=1 Tax=Haloferula chungangensis TaxID=1048331 RepID=A0ABW2L4A9_9BACT
MIQSEAVAGIPLEALVADLGGRCEGVSRLQSSATYFHEELGILFKHAEEQRLFLPSPPAELTRVSEDEGNEHQVWYAGKTIRC